MDQRLEPIINWLKDCRDHTIRIEKKETDDLDVTELKMEDVIFTERADRHFDDYIADKEIILKGEGTILHVEENPPLPGDRFEIPLIGNWEGHLKDGSLSLKTERAQYTVTKV